MLNKDILYCVFEYLTARDIKAFAVATYNRFTEEEKCRYFNSINDVFKSTEWAKSIVSKGGRVLLLGDDIKYLHKLNRRPVQHTNHMQMILYVSELISIDDPELYIQDRDIGTLDASPSDLRSHSTIQGGDTTRRFLLDADDKKWHWRKNLSSVNIRCKVQIEIRTSESNHQDPVKLSLDDIQKRIDNGGHGSYSHVSNLHNARYILWSQEAGWLEYPYILQNILPNKEYIPKDGDILHIPILDVVADIQSTVKFKVIEAHQVINLAHRVEVMQTHILRSSLFPDIKLYSCSKSPSAIRTLGADMFTSPYPKSM
jgi:hypothetical protein